MTRLLSENLKPSCVSSGAVICLLFYIFANKELLIFFFSLRILEVIILIILNSFFDKVQTFYIYLLVPYIVVHH